MKHRISNSAAIALVVLLSAGAWFTYQWVKPAAEPISETGIISPASHFLNAEAAVNFYEARLRRQPNDTDAGVQLAQVYLQLARDQGTEARYIPKAEALLASLIEKDGESYHARVLQGQLLNVLHRFEDARDLAQGIIAEFPNESFSYGILIDALVELGEYEAAVAACDQMLALRPSLPAYARAAYLRELHGDTAGAIEAMTLAAQAGVAGQADRAWALFELGNLYLGQNQVDEASAIFEGILEEVPEFARAIGGLGHAAQVRGDLETAIRHFKNAHALEQRDEFLEHLADIYDELGDATQARAYTRQVFEGLDEARAMGEWVDMEYADLLADQDKRISKALRWAEKEYERRPGHLHALETYAWTLHKAGRSEEAVPYIEAAMRLDTGDAMVHYRAGHIFQGAGLSEAAQQHFSLALENHLHVESRSAAAEARTMIPL